VGRVISGDHKFPCEHSFSIISSMSIGQAILTVDDDALVLVSIRHQLERHFSTEYVLEFAESAREGLEVIDGLNQDGIKLVVIICDFFMPGMNGDEFAREVKSSYPHLEILMLTGQADRSIKDDLLPEVQFQLSFLSHGKRMNSLVISIICYAVMGIGNMTSVFLEIQ